MLRCKNRSCKHEAADRGEFGIVPMSPTIGRDIEAVANDRPTTGAPSGEWLTTHFARCFNLSPTGGKAYRVSSKHVRK